MKIYIYVVEFTNKKNCINPSTSVVSLGRVRHKRASIYIAGGSRPAAEYFGFSLHGHIHLEVNTHSRFGVSSLSHDVTLKQERFLR